jgi:ribosomal-protein-alanine N-acetyltransferase
MKHVHLRVMREADLDQVVEIERDCFPSPWSRENFLHELRRNPAAANWVLDDKGAIVGYSCVWILGPELKINNFAVRREDRRRGLAQRMLVAVLRHARKTGGRRAHLEVRPSNRAALTLYRRFGFEQVGRRKHYYRIEGEDALLLEADLEQSIAGGAERRV